MLLFQHSSPHTDEPLVIIPRLIREVLTLSFHNSIDNVRGSLNLALFYYNLNPDFSRARVVQEQGISARRRSVLLRGLNNAVLVPLWLAFGEEH